MTTTGHAHDSSQRFIFENADIRGELVRLNKTYIDTVHGKNYPEVVSRLLGEFLAASVLLLTLSCESAT